MFFRLLPSLTLIFRFYLPLSTDAPSDLPSFQPSSVPSDIPSGECIINCEAMWRKSFYAKRDWLMRIIQSMFILRYSWQNASCLACCTICIMLDAFCFAYFTNSDVSLLCFALLPYPQTYLQISPVSNRHQYLVTFRP